MSLRRNSLSPVVLLIGVFILGDVRWGYSQIIGRDTGGLIVEQFPLGESPLFVAFQVTRLDRTDGYGPILPQGVPGPLEPEEEIQQIEEQIAQLEAAILRKQKAQAIMERSLKGKDLTPEDIATLKALYEALLRDLQNELGEKKLELDAARNQVSGLQAQVMAAKTLKDPGLVLAVLEDQLRQAAQRVAQIEAKIKEIEDRIKEVKAILEGLDAQPPDPAKAKADFGNTAKQLEADINREMAQLKNLRERLKALKEKVKRGGK